MNATGCGMRNGGETPPRRRGTFGAAIAVSAMMLAGCAGPTYGTGTPAEQQLVQDLSNVLSLAPRREQRVEYGPRPGIVKPPSTEVLPPPQQDVRRNSADWPESPEERLARIRAEATANQDNPFYRPNVIRDLPQEQQPLTENALREQQREEVLRRQQIARQGDPNTRRYLSDPPTSLRQPLETAPADDLGEDEWKKERRARGSSGLGRLLPWLN